mmetsp:Transcript_8450/g.17107  ORF Transcript_8450/g.17107 Transcript_8450/m.17107 type:complete len:236 (-) Transcript_8450:8-715(-)
MWGPCAAALRRGLEAYKRGELAHALMRYLHAAALGSAVGMANAAHILAGLDAEAAARLLPRPEGAKALALSLLREAHALGNPDASLALADWLYDEARVEAKMEAAADTDVAAAADTDVAAAMDPEKADAAEVGGAGGRLTRAAAKYATALALYRHVVTTVRDPEALYACGHMAQFGLGTAQDLERAEATFAELREMGGSEVLPGVLAQVGVNLHRVGSWLTDMLRSSHLWGGARS